MIKEDVSIDLDVGERTGHGLNLFQTGDVDGVVLGMAPFKGAWKAEGFALVLTAADLGLSRLFCSSRASTKTPIYPAGVKPDTGRVLRRKRLSWVRPDPHVATGFWSSPLLLHDVNLHNKVPAAAAQAPQKLTVG